MATNTYVALASVTASGTSSVLVMNNIPQTYTDLVLVAQYLKSGTGSARLILNNDSTSLYSQTVLYGNGTSAGSGRDSGTYFYLMDYLQSSTTNPNFATVHLMNYSNTTTFKTVIERSGVADKGTVANVGLYRSTNAITRIDIADASNFASGTTFSLYGIAADTNSTPKATGGVVSSDANYWYHTFAMSSTFTPLQSLTCDYIIVAGGGGGGGGSFANGNGGGGGGAGGFRAFTSQSFSATNYTVTVGAGGAGGSTSQGYGNSGSATSFFSTSASGGGGGGAEGVANNGANGRGSSGGSGGGSSQLAANIGSAGAAGNAGGYSPVEGYAGGFWTSPAATGSGGGGAGAQGGATGTGNGSAGVGGIGATSALINAMGAATNTGQLSGGNYYYAGGGSGGQYDQGSRTAGGLGGGGYGAEPRGVPGGAGAIATGGGGGGSNNATGGGAAPNVGGNGGSGIVIVRYAK